ncbi:hypothetical protein YenMTG1_103 [Yersinia phage vB_YenM_TG1]|uniref:Uncharacterized protein n=1 Tax=Yersinia phage vB_YenM_TG1 TaxID=1589265 RepID=A0A0B4ZZG3_9CAUD|nr:hypothetical protein AVV33_gp103 [Yersinia phage vB_YenM_TG1]AJD81913.1 hypothetical protein YenMTG1_103 [Yersinia phage vB_YenM_TG1]
MEIGGNKWYLTKTESLPELNRLIKKYKTTWRYVTFNVVKPKFLR